jgi:hypothetical protein
VEVRGFEPLTPWLQTMCSANWATPPINKLKSQIRIWNFRDGCGGGIWTRDLWVMSPTSYRTAPPRVKVKPDSQATHQLFANRIQSKIKMQLWFWSALVGLGRFELPTSRLSGVRSNRLSYRPIILLCGEFCRKKEPHFLECVRFYGGRAQGRVASVA